MLYAPEVLQSEELYAALAAADDMLECKWSIGQETSADIIVQMYGESPFSMHLYELWLDLLAEFSAIMSAAKSEVALLIDPTSLNAVRVFIQVCDLLGKSYYPLAQLSSEDLPEAVGIYDIDNKSLLDQSMLETRSSLFLLMPDQVREKLGIDTNENLGALRPISHEDLYLDQDWQIVPGWIVEDVPGASVYSRMVVVDSILSGDDPARGAYVVFPKYHDTDLISGLVRFGLAYDKLATVATSNCLPEILAYGANYLLMERNLDSSLSVIDHLHYVNDRTKLASMLLIVEALYQSMNSYHLGEVIHGDLSNESIRISGSVLNREAVNFAEGREYDMLLPFLQVTNLFGATVADDYHRRSGGQLEVFLRHMMYILQKASEIYDGADQSLGQVGQKELGALLKAVESLLVDGLRYSVRLTLENIYNDIVALRKVLRNASGTN